MNARRVLIAALSESAEVPTFRTVDRATQLVDTYRTEVLAEAKLEVVAWLVKKAREGEDIGRLASKVDRGAVRIFLGTGYYRDALDEYRAKVLREAADKLDESETLRDLTDDHMHDVNAAANELRRIADGSAS